MDVHRLRNLTFLMSLGGLSTACFNDEGPRGSGSGPGESTGGTTDATTGAVDPGTTTEADATGTTTTTGAVDTTTTSTTTEPATTTTTTTGTDASTTDVTTTTGPGPDRDVCQQYGGVYVECYPQYARFVEAVIADCEAAIEKGQEIDGPACGDAFEEFYSCISALECRQIAQEFNQPFFCAVQYEFVEQFCPETGNDL
ncbi:hypothetical protein SAMN02745121_06374 [Nannocystis exedens]|uniref:Uncharacterized protein n=1 Tax=Nannocystis exedens TaxID=54 RepID=A0A1I2F1S1_9BACT|nr:hypothetical protein [Nannocystis exedens]PCC69567.1 hypothetical protein NAEX_02589 [Nannocystis exedens]SFE98471.1 hypothetical protein SAMN02745121_06374 [Nannocystis exedens]